MAASRSLEKRLKSRHAAEMNACRVVAVCHSPEPFHLTYLRERWQEAFEDEQDSADSSDEELNPLLLDPTQWKDQDHYVILGLGKLRYRASRDDIKRAYRQKVLTHHPDKQSEENQLKEGDDLFKCIKIAHDILWDPKKRRSYDSVDPTFDETVPPVCSASRDAFFVTFGPIVAENSRWSSRQPVPQLGDEDSSIDEVDSFYSFWFNFESWREFSYQDEENPEKGDCREERRWIEKQNKAVRQKKKKEEMARLRTLVDNVYSCDPRIKKFKEAERAEKEAKKRAKAEAARKEAAHRKAEERKRQEEERLLREKEEQEAKEHAAKLKREKEAVKKALRKERKTFRATCKEHNYFSGGDAAKLVGRMQDLDRICTALSFEALQHLNQQLLTTPTPEEAERLFETEVGKLDKEEAEKLKESISLSASSSGSDGSVGRDSNWSEEEQQLLVKAVSLFPAGTVRRWETVASFVNSHSGEGSKVKDAKMVISKVKALQRLEALAAEQKDSLNKKAYSRFEQQHQVKEKGRALAEQPQATPSKRYDAPKPWTAEEQKLLEQALRQHPASLGAQRWNNIAEMVGTRSKEECVARFKELVARVKAKKQSSSTTQKTT